jgi:tRNA(His) 5'-end guanylyltransferase
MDKTSLGDRMKGYEGVTRSKVMRRTPTIIRIDGKAFHTWTKHLKHIDPKLENEPFSDVMHRCMMSTTKQLVDNMQNAVLGYTQSDEISILLNDWKKLTSDQWFDGGIQKIASVSASMATAYFNKAYDSMVGNLKPAGLSPALFDARVFNVPKEDVVNYFIWRQQDASRNSVQMLGRHYFSHKQLHKKNVSEINDMLYTEHEVMWNQIDTWKKRGSCAVRPPMVLEHQSVGMQIFAPNNSVIPDEDIPMFQEDRGYIEDLLKADDE